MISRPKTAVMYLSLLALAVAIAGCGGPADTGNRPATIAAGGTVTYNGEAVDGATVTFAPDGPGKAAIGKTDSNGNFKLMTFEAGDGAVTGKYLVTVVKQTEVAETESEDSMAESTSAAPEDLLPTKYGVATTSGLTAEVTEGGENQFTFELTD